MLNVSFEAMEPRRLLAAAAYSIVDLSTSAAAVGVTAATVAGISPDGSRIVGEGSSGGAEVAIVWVAGRHGARRVVVLPTLGGDAEAAAVNDGGQIVGAFHVTAGDPNSAEHAVLWHFNRSRGRYMAEDLGTAVGGQTGTGSQATAINASGLIVGQVSGLPNPNDNNSATRGDAMAWEVGGQGNRTAVNLSSGLHPGPGTVAGTNLPLDGPFVASAVNDAGTIAGSISTASGFGADAYVWNIGANDHVAFKHLWGDGAAADITSDGAVAVNTAIGDSITANAILLRQITRSQYRNETFQAVSGGFRSFVSAINDSDVAVGTVTDPNASPLQEAAVWRMVRHGELKATTLFSQIGAGSEWTSLDAAVGIDEGGDIVGAGTVGAKRMRF